jgi:uncharacterized membrane protein
VLRALPRVALSCLCLIGLLYVPLAVNYMWWAFADGAPRLQTGLTRLVDGETYASGPDSVDGIRRVEYASNRVILLLHTGLGGVALLLMIGQLSSRRWFDRAVLHRWVGRAYLILMTGSMLTAYAFVLSVPPVPYRSGKAFELQLFGLATMTLLTAWSGFAAARRGDAVAHRAFMAMNFSLMMTAPLLRLGWMSLGRLLPDARLLDNLDAASVALAVLAPAGGATAAALNSARHSSRGGIGRESCRLTGATSGPAVVACVVGLALVVWRFGAQRDAGMPLAYLGFHLVPWAAYLALCLAGARSAHRAGDWLRARAWIVLLRGRCWSLHVCGRSRSSRAGHTATSRDS